MARHLPECRFNRNRDCEQCKAVTKYTDAQYESINKLIKDISSRYSNIKIDNNHIFAHYQTDPKRRNGILLQNFDWSKIELTDHQTLADLGRNAPAGMGYT